MLIFLKLGCYVMIFIITISKEDLQLHFPFDYLVPILSLASVSMLMISYLFFTFPFFLVARTLARLNWTEQLTSFHYLCHREHGVVGDMRDAWPNSRVRKNLSLIRTYHGFKGISVSVHHNLLQNFQFD